MNLRIIQERGNKGSNNKKNRNILFFFKAGSCVLEMSQSEKSYALSKSNSIRKMDVFLFYLADQNEIAGNG